MGIRLLIVDDEALIRDGIRSELASLADIEIIGECENGAQAIEAILEKQPDVVLLDVQMPDCSGLQVVREIGSQRMPLVIFVTAYDQYAVKAFEMSAIDYLLKPFDGNRLRASVDRARKRLDVAHQSLLTRQLEKLLHANQHHWPQRLVIRNGDCYQFVAMESIDWVESANNYVQLHCGTKTYLMYETLTGMEARLDPRKFTRVHRRKIVNISHVTVVHHLLGGTYELELHNGVRLTTGRQYREAIQALIRP